MSRVRSSARLPGWVRVPGLLLLALLCTSGAPSVRKSIGGTIPPDRPRAVLVPFENLAGREEQGALFTKVFFAQLVASGALEMVDPARVEEAMDSLAIRGAGSLTPEQMRLLGEAVQAPVLLVGSVLESGTYSDGGVEYPAVGATLRLVQAATGRVAWAGVHFRSGQDRERIFGWGRVRSTERLVSEMAAEMLVDFRQAGAGHARVRTGGSR